MSQVYTVNTLQASYGNTSMEIKFIAENQYGAVCPVLDQLSQIKGYKRSKQFASFVANKNGKKYMSELFSQLNPGWTRVFLGEDGADRQDGSKAQYFHIDNPSTPVPANSLPKFVPLYIRLNADNLVTKDQTVSFKRNAVYFVHPCLFNRLMSWMCKDPTDYEGAFQDITNRLTQA